MKTREVKTTSEIIEAKLPRVIGNNQHKSKTIVALDGGYSAVKGVSPNKIFSFPSYVKKVSNDLETVTEVDSSDLRFRDNETGEIWLVGHSAEVFTNQSDIDATTDSSLYTRYRYDSDLFKISMLTGLALGLKNTGKTDEIFLQTGLPASYKQKDQENVRNVLVGDYNVSIKVGNEDWYDLCFKLPAENIDVIEQPQGTLCACTYADGNVAPEGVKILKSKGTLILDIGFGTEDIFSFRAGYKDKPKTYSDTAMRSVFEKVVEELQDITDVDVKVFELQNYLENGIFSYVDQSFTTKNIDFTEMLNEANRILCEKSIKRLMREYDNLAAYEYLIVTGGTGQARFEQICEMLSGLSNLKILPGNVNTPELSCTYANVMGYYMYRHAKHSAETKQLES